MKDKTKVLILFGGVSSEHEVSRVSASSILAHISEDKYEINTVGITKEGNWFLTSSPAVRIGDGSWEQDPGNRKVAVCLDRDFRGLLVREADGSTRELAIDVVFPVLHGRNGEDGRLNSDKVLFSFARGRERCDRNGHAVFLRPGVDFATTGSEITGISTSSTKLK